jgi:hypothetical protein
MKNYLIVLSILFSSTLVAQDLRFGKVSKEELTKEKSTIDPEAAAEILYEKMDVLLEYDQVERKFIVKKEVEGRIKVYKKDNTPNDFLGQEVTIYVPGSTREKLSGFRGSTYNLEGGKIEETKVKGSDIFTEKNNKYWETQKFAFSNVKDGSVVEYKYTILSPYYRNIDRWFFQTELPVVNSQFKFTYPEIFTYSPDIRGEVKGRMNNTTRPVPNMKFNNNIVEFTYTNVKGLDKEPYVLNSDNLKASVRYELMLFSFPGYITENYSATWEQIGKDLNNHDNIGKQLIGNNFLDETVQTVAGSIPNQLEKTEAIFNYVKNNFAWNRTNGIHAENGVRSTFKDKRGNSADINLTLVSMLQKAGINANPVVLSTVNNLIVNYSFPSVSSLNFLIASAEINGNLYLMDATEKLSKINMLPLRDLNHRGFQILGNGSIKELSLNNYALSNIKQSIMATLNPDGTISGNYVETKDEYFAMMDNMSKRQDAKEFEKYYLEDFSFDVDNFKIDENEEKGIIRYSFKFENVPSADVMGNKILINPTLFSQLMNSKFQYENRNYPLEFGTASNSSYTVKIKIPEGYKIESLPQEKQFVIEGNKAGYLYKVEEKDGFIVLNKVEQIAQSILPPSYYKMMKEFEKNQINAEAQQVVLVKL